jgi:hypothetical protein
LIEGQNVNRPKEAELQDGLMNAQKALQEKLNRIANKAAQRAAKEQKR